MLHWRRRFIPALPRMRHPNVGQRIRRQFATGLLLLLPLGLTLFLLRVAFEFLDGLLQPIFDAVLDRRIPGIGLLALIALVFIVGAVGSSTYGRKAMKGIEALMLTVPLVRNIYSIAMQFTEIFSGSQTGDGAKRVVVIEYPRQGIWSVGFLVALTQDENGRSMAVVYIPTAPMPNSGWVAIVSAQEVYETDLSVQEASQMTLSGGILTPDAINKRPMHQSMVEKLQADLEAQREELERRRRELEQMQSLMEHPEHAGISESRDRNRE